MPRRVGRYWVATVIAAVLSVLPGTTGAPPVASAATEAATLLFVDTAYDFGEEVVQNFSPRNANVGIEWTGTGVFVSAENTSIPGTENFHNVYFVPPLGTPLTIGTYSNALQSATPEFPALGRTFSGSGSCYGGQFEITAIEPNLQPGVPTTKFEFAASFTQTCGMSEIHGEVRYESTIPVSAVGYATKPQEPGDLVVVEPDAIAGGLSQPGSIVLKNYGTTPLTFGAASFSNESTAEFQVSANTCATQPVVPLGTCRISVRARQWMPGFFTDHFTVPVSTARGVLGFRIHGTARDALLVPIDPIRIVDTRSGMGISNNLKSGQARTIQVRGSGGIPAEAIAVVGNLTITGNSSNGYASMTTSPENTPTVSTINTKLADTRANGLIVRLTDSGAAAVTWVGTAGSTAHAIFDATGYFIQGGTGFPGATGFSALKSFRILDTRSGLGLSTSLLAGQPRTFNVPLPAPQAGHTAVAANLTVVGASRAGYISVTPVATADPTTSTLNFPSGDTRANNLIARLGANHSLSIVYKGPPGSRVHVILDINGSFGAAGGTLWGYVPLVPHRAIDTRFGLGINSKLKAKLIYSMALVGANPNDRSRNIPEDYLVRVGGYTGNATIVGQDSGGYLSIYPDPMGMPPSTSTLNAPLGDVRANGVIVGGGFSSPKAAVAAYFGAAPGRSTHFIFDATGYFWAGTN